MTEEENRTEIVRVLRDYAAKIERGDAIHCITTFGQLKENNLYTTMHDFGAEPMKDALVFYTFKHHMFMAFRNLNVDYPRPQ